MYGGRPVSLYGCALALVVAVIVDAAPSSAQFFESIEFDDATALVMQGNLVNGPNASCDSAGDEVPHPGTFVFRNNDPGADYLYQSYDLYNNGPTRCVRLQVTWIAQDCNPLHLGLALYLDSFNPADPRQNLLAHSYFFEHSFGFGDPRHWNDYYYSPGFYHDGVQAYHLDTIHLGAEVPALAKVVAVLDSLDQPGATNTCPINSATASST